MCNLSYLTLISYNSFEEYTEHNQKAGKKLTAPSPKYLRINKKKNEERK